MRKVIPEDSDTWRAIGYLKELQILISRTSFRVRYDKHYLLDSTVWMAPFMKNNIVRYGGILCLDAQKWQYNHLG